MAAADRRIAAIRDVLASGLRDLALRVSQIDVSDPTPPREQVEQWVQNVSHELRKADERGARVGDSVAVYADPKLIAAAVQLSQQSMRVQYRDDRPAVLFVPPPADYALGTIEQEIDKAAQEATPTDPPPAQHVQPCMCVECVAERADIERADRCKNLGAMRGD